MKKNSMAIVNRSAKIQAHDRLASIAAAFYSRRSPSTRRAYGKALLDFARFMGSTDGIKTIMALIESGQGAANLKVMEYMASLKVRELAPASMNQRLAAIKGMVKLARQAGLMSWTLDVEGERSETYRDTRGPGVVAVTAMLRAAAGAPGSKAARDFAIMRTLFDLGLRRAELCSLDMNHLDMEGRRLSIKGKGRSSREFLSLPEPTAAALDRWIEIRGGHPGPIFSSMDRAHKGDGRLQPDGVYRLVRASGNAIGCSARPHGLRHSGITAIGELTKGNLVAMAAFSRHKKLDVLRRYMDNMENLQGSTAALLAGAASTE